MQLPAFFVNGAGELMKADRRRTADYRALILPTEGAFFKQSLDENLFRSYDSII